jgi:hypothetical protein
VPTLTWIGKDAVVNHHHEAPNLACGPADSAITKVIGGRSR